MDPELEESGESPSLEDQLADAIGVTEPDPVVTPADPEAPAAPTDAPAADPAAPAADPAAAPVDPAAVPAPEVKPDANADLYAPLPEHNPRKTHERFAKLVEGHKEISQKYEAAVQEREQIKSRVQQYEQGLQPLREMGFNTPDAVQDLQQFSQYRKALQSGNVDSAMQILQAQMNQLALASGRRVEVNPLTSFPDLAERVQVGDLDERTALELARSRHGQSVQQQHQQRIQHSEQQHAQQMQVIRQGALAVDQVVQQLQQDPDYRAVEPELVKQLDYIKTNYLPHQWAGEIKRSFDTARQMLALRQQQAVQQRQPQPLRGNGHAGGQPAPASMQDAVLQELFGHN
jgi:hypothetical protein